ncbi:STAS domain-containing protein [Fontivita pretiosa]|uniref:STAS domain-containing protein n=1 Tax=Fontivita pretiosa TaxID=2989684 RepID=UPI003D17EC86
MTQANNNLGSSPGSGPLAAAASVPFIVQQVDKFTVIEFRQPSLMDPVQLETIGQSLYRLVDAEDRRRIVLDFEKVQYLSSQAIGIILTMNKKLSQLKNSQLVLCGVGPRLQELLKITRLDRLLTIRPTQREAVRVGAV